MTRKFLLTLLVFLPGCGTADTAPATAQPNVILITLDTTRADRMGFLGSKRGLTPHLDALAREGTVFTRAYSQAPLTTVSHATLLTGTYPPFHAVEDFSVPLPDDVPDLAVELKQRGYRTAAFVGALILDPVNGMAPNFNRGFDVYDAGYRLRRDRADDRYQSLERRAEDVVARAQKWLEANSSQPFFLWVHVFDPHEPYEAPAPWGQRHKDPYDCEIAYTDSVMGKLFDFLRQRNLMAGTTIVVASDHGEAFGEHGEFTHGVFLYDTTIHVPLVIKFHDGHWKGVRYTGQVSLVDVAPTVLAAANAPVPQEMQGRNLIPLLQRPPADLPSYAETQYPRRAFGWSALHTLRSGGQLYVQAPRPELYDVTADPETKQDLAEARKADARRMDGQLENFKKRVESGRTPENVRTKADPRLLEKLTALGYVSGGAATTKPDNELPDPKDKIQVANQLHSATLMIEQGEQARAIPTLQRILATDPQIFVAQMQLGLAYSKQKNYREAIAPLRKATDLMPTSGPAHFALGRSLLSVGEIAAAATHFEIVVTQIPQWAGAHFLLATAYAITERPQQAMDSCRTALKYEPSNYGANLLLGRMLTVHGDPAGGLPHLEKAVELRPNSAEGFRLLADTYARLGRAADAERARAAAARLRGAAPVVDP